MPISLPLPLSRRLPIAGAVGLAALLTACGTGARATTTASTAPTSAAAAAAASGASGPSGPSGGGGGRLALTDAQRAELKLYSDCLTQHGVTIRTLVRLASGQGFGGRPSGATGPNGPSGQVDPNGPSGPSGQRGQGGFGGGTPTTIDQAAFKVADAACASSRPTDINITQLLQPRTGGGFGNRQNSAAFRAYVSCLADHGVKVTTPTTLTPPTTAAGSSSTVAAPVPTFDRNDPNYAAANTICRALLPTGGSGATGSTTTSTSQA